MSENESWVIEFFIGGMICVVCLVCLEKVFNW